VKRAALFLVAAALTTTLAACSSGDDTSSDSTASPSSTAKETAKADSTAAAAEPNIALACGRYYNGGESSLKVRIAAVAPAMDAQDAGTPLDADTTDELGAIDSSLVLAIKVSPAPLADAFTAIQARIEGALAAAESGGTNAATLDLPTQDAAISTECVAGGFPVS